MIPLRWYEGIDKDVETAISGNGVVIHADEHVCRVLMKYESKLGLCGFPSKQRLNFISAHKDTPFLRFNGVEYCADPCYVYAVANPQNKNNIKAMYMAYLGTSIDMQLDTFLATRRETMRSLVVPSKNKKDADSENKYFIIISHDGKTLGRVEFSVMLKEIDDNDCFFRVVHFDKKGFRTEVNRLIDGYGKSFSTDQSIAFIDNLLRDFAVQLKYRAIDFDPVLFD